MIYSLLRPLIRFGLQCYCKKIHRIQWDSFPTEGPLLICANHPNSLIDPLLIATQVGRPVHFMVRSDMFQIPIIGWLLKSLNGIPVYRQTEERDKLLQNYSSFAHAAKVLQAGGVVLLFSEGVTELEWQIRPIKKATGRLLWHVKEKYPETFNHLQIWTVGLSYGSFRHFQRNVLLHALPAFTPAKTLDHKDMHSLHADLQKILSERFQATAITAPIKGLHVPSVQHAIQLMNSPINQQQFQQLKSLLQTTSLPLPWPKPTEMKNFEWHNYSVIHSLTAFVLALPGIVFFAPFYFPIKHLITRKTKGTIFYDTLFFGCLAVGIPLYSLFICTIFSGFGIGSLGINMLFIVFISWLTLQNWPIASGAMNYKNTPAKDRGTIQNWQSYVLNIYK